MTNYVGKPMLRKGATLFWVALDSYESCEYAGVVKQLLTGKCWRFNSVLDLINIMRSLTQEWIPATHRERTWQRNIERKERLIPISDNVELSWEGITFLLHIQYRQNSTWQGTLEWIEGRQKVSFRSTLELLQLMEKVVGATTAEIPKFVSEDG